MAQSILTFQGMLDDVESIANSALSPHLTSKFGDIQIEVIDNINPTERQFRVAIAQETGGAVNTSPYKMKVFVAEDEAQGKDLVDSFVATNPTYFVSQVQYKYSFQMPGLQKRAMFFFLYHETLAEGQANWLGTPTSGAGGGGVGGAQGAQGVPGPAGVQGSPGAAGATGSSGAQGNLGPVGPQGPQGVQGPAGAGSGDVSGPGLSVNYSIPGWSGAAGTGLLYVADAPLLNASGELTLTKNLNMNAGWMILQGSSKAGFGGVPNRNTSAKIQAYGAINSDGGYEFYAPSEGAGTTTHAFYVSGAASLYTFILRNYFNDFTISSVRSKAGAPTTADRESTMALVRTDDAGNEEIVDYYNQTYYASGDKIAKAMGIRMIAVGTGLLRPFYVDWKRSTGVVVDGLKITPPTDDAGTGARADWAIPVYDKNGAEVLGGGGAVSTAPDIIVEHRTGAGVGGGAKNATSVIPVFNTIIRDTTGALTVSASTLNVPAGTYYVEFDHYTMGTGATQAYIRDLSVATLLTGTTVDSGAGTKWGGMSRGSGMVTFAVATDIQMGIYGTSNNAASDALGDITNNAINIHGQIRMWKQ